MKAGKKAIVCMLCVCALLAGLLTGCGKKKMTDAEYEELAKTTAAANAKKVVMTLEKDGKVQEVTLDMLTYYLAYYETQGLADYTQNAATIKEFYGENVDYWALPANTGGNGMTNADAYKETVRVSELFTLLMSNEATEAGMTLTENRKAVLDTITENFLKVYTPEERARCGMTADVIRANYEKVLFADQFSEVAASNVKVDRDEVAKTVDKELYRIYQTNYLYLTKSNDNEELVSKAGDTAARLKTMEECLAKAQGGKSLEDIQKEYADILVYATRDFQRVNTSNIEPDYVTAVLAMKKGDIQLYETSYGIYVIELVDDSTFYGYEDAVTAACELESNRGIKAIYDDIEKRYKITYTEAWDEIKMGTVLKAKQ
ncbi:MAG: hypothetical protein J5531_00190 [Lachnospiraceae bacterium]|nr:hypothetical protein [Lachnospiraceae bacterium]